MVRGTCGWQTTCWAGTIDSGTPSAVMVPLHGDRSSPPTQSCAMPWSSVTPETGRRVLEQLEQLMVTSEGASGLAAASRTITSTHTEPFAVTVTEGGLVDLEELGIPAIAGEKGVWARHAIAATIAARRVTIREQIRRDMGP